MSLLEAIILGIVQGLTEFLPVSSSGHIEIAKSLLGVQLGSGEEELLFTILLHGATALSTIVVFRKYIFQLIKDLFSFQWNDSTKFSLFIALSMIPAAIVGVLFKDELEALMSGRVLWVGVFLIITAILLYFTDVYKPKSKDLGAGNSFMIGVAQAIAILPGISRSGATIATALLLGVSREKAASFSFLMVLPLIFGAMAKEFMDAETIVTETTNIGVITAGFIAAFVSGIFACNWMIALVKKSKLTYFAIYCLLVGVLTIIFS